MVVSTCCVSIGGGVRFSNRLSKYLVLCSEDGHNDARNILR